MITFEAHKTKPGVIVGTEGTQPAWSKVEGTSGEEIVASFALEAKHKGASAPVADADSLASALADAKALQPKGKGKAKADAETEG